MPKIDVFAEINKKSRFTLILTMTEDCNLRCKYCYEENKIKNHVLDVNLAKQAIEKVMDNDDILEDEVEIQFFGGEPMLAFDNIREIVSGFTLVTGRRNIYFLLAQMGLF